jgi:hypothetical protein
MREFANLRVCLFFPSSSTSGAVSRVRLTASPRQTLLGVALAISPNTASASASSSRCGGSFRGSGHLLGVGSGCGGGGDAGGYRFDQSTRTRIAGASATAATAAAHGSISATGATRSITTTAIVCTQ